MSKAKRKKVSEVCMSIHCSGVGSLGIEICLTRDGLVHQGELVKDFKIGDRSVLEMSEEMCEFDEVELSLEEEALVINECKGWFSYAV
jgi:hypothetical protein